MSSLARPVVQGSALGILQATLGIPVALVSIPLFLRGLGPTGFGYWGLLQGFFSALNLLSVGTTDATLYFVARDDSEASGPGARARTRALFLVVLLGCAAGGLILLLGPAYGLGALLRLPGRERGGFERLLGPAAALWCCQFLCLWLQLLPRSRHEYGVLTRTQIGLTLAAPLLGWAVLQLFAGDERAFLWGQAAAWAAGCAGLLAWNARHPEPLDLRPGADAPALREVAAYARWAFVFMLSVVVLNSADRILLAGLGAEALVGFTVAVSLTQRVYAVTGLVTSSLQPALARIREGVELERLRRGFSVSLRALAFFWAALLLPLAAWGDRFMAAWMKNPALADATYPALLLLCVAAYFGALASGCHAALLGTGRPRQAAVTGLAGAAVGLAVAIPAIARFGVPGAALLGLVGNALAFALRIGFMEKARFGRPLAPLALEAALGLGVLGGAWALLRRAAPLLAGSGLAVTAGSMLLTAGLLLALGLGLDTWLSPLRGRSSLLQILQGLRSPAGAGN